MFNKYHYCSLPDRSHRLSRVTEHPGDVISTIDYRLQYINDHPPNYSHHDRCRNDIPPQHCQGRIPWVENPPQPGPFCLRPLCLLSVLYFAPPATKGYERMMHGLDTTSYLKKEPDTRHYY